MEPEKSVVYSFCYFLWCLHGCLESAAQESSIKSLHNFPQLTLIKLAVLEGHSVNLGYKLPAVSFQLWNSEILVPGQAISFRRVVLYQLVWNGWTQLHQSREQRQELPLLVGTAGPLQRVWEKPFLSTVGCINTNVRREVPLHQVLLLIVC